LKPPGGGGYGKCERKIDQIYFSYGSNMDVDQMEQRCPGAEVMGRCQLEHYELAFTRFSPKRQCGVLDVIKKKGSVVWGVLYKITMNELKILDGFEAGTLQGYQRIKVEVLFDENKNLTAWTYIVVNKNEVHAPNLQYWHHLFRGSQDFSFPRTYQKMILGLKQKCFDWA